MLGWALGLAYLFVCRSCFYGHVFWLWLIPLLTISPATEGLKEIGTGFLNWIFLR